MIAITVFYMYSYLRNWYFEKVSLVFVGVGATALVMDYFNAYVYLSENPTQWIAGLIALRLGAIFLSVDECDERAQSTRDASLSVVLIKNWQFLANLNESGYHLCVGFTNDGHNTLCFKHCSFVFVKV